MDLQLKNKIALVSASSGGIGQAIASRLAGEGAVVYINGRTKEKVDAAIKAIKKIHPDSQLKPLAADLGTKEGVAKAIKELPEVDILVNNLGIYEVAPFAEITDEQWQNIFEINVMSGVRLGRHYLPKMLKKNWGRVIFISSESALGVPVEMVHYGMTKAAQLAIARGMAETTAGTNVTVNSVLPGPTKSEGVEQFIKENAVAQNKTPEQIEKEFFVKMRPSSLIKRFASPDEVANIVAYVSSPLASATNGAALRVDGGTYKSIT